jgi:triacylglycerol lipase
VVVLHGLARTKTSMKRLETFLCRHGFFVVNLGYPSRRYPIEYLSQTTLSKAIDICSRQQATTIHFVTHSMGGILVRYFLAKNPIENLGRVVMLSPPNQGSEVVDFFNKNIFFKWLNGPAGGQLGTDRNSLPSRLPPLDYDVGIIAGDRSINLFLSMLIPGKNDGKVSIERTQVDGMKDFLGGSSCPSVYHDPSLCFEAGIKIYCQRTV